MDGPRCWPPLAMARSCACKHATSLRRQGRDVNGDAGVQEIRVAAMFEVFGHINGTQTHNSADWKRNIIVDLKIIVDKLVQNYVVHLMICAWNY
eukprot:38329-Amphidinium_carterae.2